ncbi:TRAP transporter small permease subunit [Oceanisphaera sediminis]|uniref:TRAP transporter small permease protein n=1 Tax=Oceanisphaera sediminis TaxID=981381 RepID=A0ABP7DMI2_9GAMM
MLIKYTVDMIDGLNHRLGEALKWGLLLTVFLTAITAILRYMFGIGFPWLSEAAVWMNAMVFTLGSAWVLQQEGHVRVDLFYGRLSEKGKAWINLFGSLVLLYPMLWVIAVKSWPTIYRSWSQLEGSPTINGLPFMYLLKSCIGGFCILLALQGLSMILRSILVIKTPRPRESGEYLSAKVRGDDKEKVKGNFCQKGVNHG